MPEDFSKRYPAYLPHITAKEVEIECDIFCFDLKQMTAHTDTLFTPDYVRQSVLPEPDGYNYKGGNSSAY